MLARHQANTDDAVDPNAMQAYAPLLEALREVFDVDFAAYKEATLLQRFERWKQLEGPAFAPPRSGAARARPGPDRRADQRPPADQVTGFLRDAEAFDALRQLVIEPAVARAAARGRIPCLVLWLLHRRRATPQRGHAGARPR